MRRTPYPHIENPDEVDRLFLLVGNFCVIDRNCERVSSVDMGYIFWKLIRRFDEASALSAIV